MRQKFKKILTIGLVIAIMMVTPVMAYTNDAPPFEFVTGDNIKMHVGDNADLILARLGEPNSTEKTEMEGGKSWYYAYDGFIIYTWNPDKGKETITGIDITGSGESTKEGVGIDSTESEMLKRYGNKGYSSTKNKGVTTYTYQKGSSFLNFIIDCFNKITRISYS